MQAAGWLSQRPWLRRWGGMALVVVAICAAFFPALQGGFVWDDNAHVTRPDLRSPSGLARIWFDVGATQQYYPLLYSAFWIEHQLWGDHPLGYHLVNLALHAAAACLVYLILRKLAIPGAVGRRHLRRASGAGGIGRLDQRTKKHALGGILSQRTLNIPALRPNAPAPAVCACAGAVRVGGIKQNDDRDSSRGAVGDLLVAAGPLVVAARRAAPDPVFPAGGHGGLVRRLGGTEGHRRGRGGFRFILRRARFVGGPRDLVLPGETGLAGET